jgi:Tfp pilus assembly protein PilN
MRRSRVGLTFDDGHVVVTAVRGPGRLEQFRLEPDETLAARLATELDARGLGRPRVRVGIDRSLAVVKTLELPRMASGRLRPMVAFELERHVPFPTQDIRFDCVPVGDAPSDTRRILVMAAEGRTVDGALRLLDTIKRPPQSVTAACHDLPALLSRRHPGGRAGRLDSPPRPAHRPALRGPGRGAPEPEGADRQRRGACRGDHPQPAAGRLARVRRDLGLGRRGGAHAGGPEARREARAGVRAAVRPGGSTPDRAAAHKAARRRAPRPGGRHRASSSSPQPPARRGPAALDDVDAPAHGGLAATAAVLGLGMLLAHGHTQERYLARVSEEIRRLDPGVKAVEQLGAQVLQQKRLLATLHSVETGGLRPLPVLRELTELIPTDAWLQSLAMDRQGLELNGQATAASQLIPLLDGSPSLERVEFTAPVTRVQTKEQFRIRASWEEPAPSRAGPSDGADQ